MFLELVFNYSLSRTTKPSRRISLLDDDFVCDNEPSPMPHAADSLQVRPSDLELLRTYSTDACSADAE